MRGVNMAADRSNSGRKHNQKMKPYIILDYLRRSTDEKHTVSAGDIVAYLQELGIDAERRAIYKDIASINATLHLLENRDDEDIEIATEAVTDTEERYIVYDPHAKGFRFVQSKYELSDIRLIAECIHAAKFIPDAHATRLTEVVYDFVSEHHANRIKHDALVVDRVKTLNRSVLNNISLLRDAMASELDGQPHTPEKISFNYLAHEVTDIEKPVERRHKYVVSPYYLIINDGNYYLLAFDDKSQDIRTFRVDRMKNLCFTNEARDGKEAFSSLDIKTYTRRVFSMYGGERKQVTIRFVNYLLDAVIDRFGIHGAEYRRVDDKHFSVTAEIEISNQFYAWVCGFGKRAKILYPPDVREQFLLFIQGVSSLYTP